MVGHSHFLAEKPLRSRFWWCIVRNSNLFLPAFCKLWSDIHTFLQKKTPPLPLLMMYCPKFQPFLTCFLQTMVRHSHLFAAKKPPLPLLMMYSRAFAPFITHFLQTMVGHSHLLAEKHHRSQFWWCIVRNSKLFLPDFCKLLSDIHNFLQQNTSAPAFDDI